MSTVRQDAWSTDEDLILAEVVLRHIREGSTQLAAFEEVGDRLSRTSAACGFRWNSTIRKKYESAILLAKKQRSKGKRLFQTTEYDMEPTVELQPQLSEEKAQVESETEELLTMEKVVSFLNDFAQKSADQVSLTEFKELQEENKRLKNKLEHIEQEKKVMEDDYRTLLSIMERARKLTTYETTTES
ncbi:RsfA family transcriptional regulator [Halalkalibacter sp. APA_J-10(15)]|uniref:RsfA family transcriptional regulator n=1 Tax=unclassified Halalkalibacter TaxID=2893063 RepID=UPI001FF16FE4|nr:RsfA family transcriptional regulator [Halalkalibacter sp. APA_J-10(15)]MCK0470649.1 RsfA family transcriptional regulator [Halalkalibacter sp. APA_J-10(15)]